MRFFLSVCMCFSAILHCNAQNELLTWKDHFSYRKVQTVTATSDAIYAATSLGAFKVLLEDNSITRLNKTNKLSDTGISFMEGVPDLDMVIIGYSNGNLDIVIEGRVINLADIKNSSILASKSINEILVYENFAYICTEFGIVKLDLERLEINDTYLIGDEGDFINVTDLAVIDGKFIASTEMGLFQAETSNVFLSNFESWSVITDSPSPAGFYKHMTVFGSYLYVNIEMADEERIYRNDFLEGSTWELIWSDDIAEVRDLESFTEKMIITAKGKTVELDESLTILREISSLGPGYTDNYQTMVSPDGNGIWIANNRAGLYHVTNFDGIQEIIPNGPQNSEARRIRSYFETVWSSTGGVNLGYVNNFTQNGINFFIDNKWGSITRQNDPLMDGVNDFGGVAFDIMDVAITPSNNDVVYASSWDEGVFKIVNGQIDEIYNTSNSTLIGVRPDFDNKVVNVDGIAFDDDENLWVSNSFTETCLHALSPSGDWYGFDFSPDVDETFKVGEILIDRNQYIWAVLANGNGILVFDWNGTLADTSDDRYKILSIEEGNGALPNDDVYSITQDVNGEIWVGTLQGVAVFYNTACIFTDEECDSQQILIQQDGNFQLLLETETVTSIEVDGGNRKWIGTQTSGAYLLSDDGIDQVYRFTEDNSPLLSNTIQDISFNFSTGEIFFATDRGIVSFIGTATGFDGSISETTIYPNPVREDYEGLVTIDGLTFRTDVRITDINGNIVHSTTSEGGRAVWNGKNELGERVSTGVYLVFATSRDGKETTVGKVAVIN